MATNLKPNLVDVNGKAVSSDPSTMIQLELRDAITPIARRYAGKGNEAMRAIVEGVLSFAVASARGLGCYSREQVVRMVGEIWDGGRH